MTTEYSNGQQRPDSLTPYVDIKDIAARAVSHIEAICRQWLPNGKRQGVEWIALNPKRDDAQRGSFKINLTTGIWSDFATGDGGGDLVNLIAYLENTNQINAAQRLADWLGVMPSAPLTKPKPHRLILICPTAHPTLGKPVQQWEYHAADGRLLGKVCRFETATGKEFRPLTHFAEGWQWKALPEPRPLYGLNRLAARPDATVIVCEGEKAADAATELFPDSVAITSMNGALSPQKTDWSPLKGRRIRLWPDNDRAGMQYAETVAALAYKAGAVSVERIDLSIFTFDGKSTIEEGFDAFNALNEHRWDSKGIEHFERWLTISPPLIPASISTVDSTDWPELFDLSSPGAEATPYPLDAFPPIARAAISEYATFGKQPIALAASAALGQMALAAQGLADVARDAYLVSPISLYLMTIAESGERKSAADKQFSRAFREWVQSEREYLLPEHRKSFALVSTQKTQVEGKKNRIKTLASKDDQESRTEIERLEKEIVELECNPIVVMPLPNTGFEDVNSAALSYAVATGWPSSGLFSDEGGMVIGSQGLGDDNATSLLSLLNTLWDGRTSHATRKQAATAEIRGRRFSSFLMLQPDLLPKLIDKGARGLGFMARFLMSTPATTMGTRFYTEPPKDWLALNQFDAQILQLLKEPLPIDNSREDQGARMMLAPPIMRLDTGAKAMWVEFHDAVERELCRFGDFAQVRDIASKAAENAVRIAAVFKLFDQGKTGEWVEPEYMRGGIDVARWHLHEARRLFLDLDTPPEIQDARELSAWLTGKGRELIDAEGAIPLRTIGKFGPNRVRDTLRRDEAIDQLVEAGHVRILTIKRQKKIKMNPKLLK
ncbi:DUF3987 domain-containing protein [Chromatium okenii]|jgi:hypothetical protein|uniref:DUF3987 domain-containing protein n=1 Tax=Chromatium okenii TaxID=61644 RepID=UPI0026EAFF1B|nr:DUF3987 domain-containing protein [Chromatium okenii]MBV5311046.1 DUF3987 domain-containing protein [Chromatium okenii]